MLTWCTAEAEALDSCTPACAGLSTAQVMIVDECAGCKGDGDVDFSSNALKAITGGGRGRGEDDGHTGRPACSLMLAASGIAYEASPHSRARCGQRRAVRHPPALHRPRTCFMPTVPPPHSPLQATRGIARRLSGSLSTARRETPPLRATLLTPPPKTTPQSPLKTTAAATPPTPPTTRTATTQPRSRAGGERTAA